MDRARIGAAPAGAVTSAGLRHAGFELRHAGFGLGHAGFGLRHAGFGLRRSRTATPFGLAGALARPAGPLRAGAVDIMPMRCGWFHIHWLAPHFSTVSPRGLQPP